MGNNILNGLSYPIWGIGPNLLYKLSPFSFDFFKIIDTGLYFKYKKCFIMACLINFTFGEMGLGRKNRLLEWDRSWSILDWRFQLSYQSRQIFTGLANRTDGFRQLCCCLKKFLNIFSYSYSVVILVNSPYQGDCLQIDYISESPLSPCILLHTL